MAWVRDAGLELGLSLMFGGISPEGELLETATTVGESVELAQALSRSGASIAGFFPNVLTVLPGTALARGLARTGVELDFYRMPCTGEFDGLEDGQVGYNFLSLGLGEEGVQRVDLVRSIVEASAELVGLGVCRW